MRAFDQAAWERLVELYTPLVYAWCRGAGLQEADALDVGQEVFRSVLTAIIGFRRERPEGSFRGWLRTIAHNKICDFFRRREQQRVREGEWQPPAVFPETTSEALAAETVLLYRRALELIHGEFSEQYFQAFWRVVIDGWPPADVAVDLKMSVNSVCLAKSRILHRLREEFTGLLDDDRR